LKGRKLEESCFSAIRMGRRGGKATKETVKTDEGLQRASTDTDLHPYALSFGREVTSVTSPVAVLARDLDADRNGRKDG
jgi:hypothetical protein